MTDQEIIERYRAIEAKIPENIEGKLICNNTVEYCILNFCEMLLDRDEVVKSIVNYCKVDSGYTPTEFEYGIADAIIEAQKEKING